MVITDSSSKTSAYSLVGATIVLAGASGLLLGAGTWEYGLALACVTVVLSGYVLKLLSAWTAAGETVPAWERVRREIERARRLNSSLVVARLPLTPSGTTEVHSIADRAEVLLRDSDAVWVEDRSILMLLADSDRDSAQNGIDRVVEELADPLDGPIVASFPEDELTLGGLIDRLYPPRRVRPMSGIGGAAEEATPPAVFPVDDEGRQASA